MTEKMLVKLLVDKIDRRGDETIVPAGSVCEVLEIKPMYYLLQAENGQRFTIWTDQVEEIEPYNFWGLVEVMKLGTNEIRSYVGTEPRKAVIAAYAQDNGDWNTWNYSKYDSMIEEGESTLLIGDWSVFKDGRRISR